MGKGELAGTTRLREGDSVERDLDGMWFPGRIERVCRDGGDVCYDIVYLDDGNRESNVPWDELRFLDDDAAESKGGDDAQSPCKAVPLRPLEDLVALVDDQAYADEFKSPVADPKSIVHGINDEEHSDSTFIVNDEDAKLATGGGLRGIRFLRKTSRPGIDDGGLTN